MDLVKNILLILLLFHNTFSFSINSPAAKQNGCNILIKDKTLPRILYLKSPSTPNGYTFYWPDPFGNIKFANKQEVNLQCPGSKVVAGNTILDTSVTASCESNDKFSINKVQYEYKKIGCLNEIQHVAKIHKEKCYNNLDLIHIQYELKGQSLFQIQVCFDKFSGNTLYTHHLVPNIIKGSQSYPSSERPRFIQGIFYDELEKKINLNSLYYVQNHKRLINELVGLPLDSKKYVDEDLKNQKFLSKGHLAPNADFVYNIQKELTFYYINVAPQWQSINGGNWETLEKNVKDYIAANYDNNIREFNIYTLTLGIATLPHETKNTTMVKLYLYKGASGRYGIPVPRSYVKIVYHPQTLKGTVFFTVNNPYIKLEDVPDYIICKDISANINWLTWKKNDIKLGVSFACDPRVVSKILPHFPRLKVTGLLPNLHNYSYYNLTEN